MSLRSTLLSVGLTCAATFAMAQSPSAPLTIVVPYPAGGPLDTSARIVAEGAAAQLGSITVENKPGRVAIPVLTRSQNLPRPATRC